MEKIPAVNSVLEALENVPLPAVPEQAAHGIAAWLEEARQADEATAAFAQSMADHPRGGALLAAIFGNSPYLSHLMQQHPAWVHTIFARGAETAWQELMAGLAPSPAAATSPQEMMRLLRVAKGKAALLVAIADVAGWWKLEAVTGHLSSFADASLSLAVDFLLFTAHRKGEIVLAHPDTPSWESGFIVLGMGKLGGRELNYSSDIDLILFFEKERISYQGRQTVQHFCNRLAQDLVQLMHERTADGYVFRTDLRLRPDPASTPPALSTGAALAYYESVGQNWERAALIKARPVAGDLAAGDAFMRQLVPFLWRKHLDFAAIDDIHSIKRQMDGRGGSGIAVPGHNIKIGRGGIREIEFFVQIHQLIWGGRKPELRTRGTCETLATLVQEGLVEGVVAKTLHGAYGFLRQIEHRLQMTGDQQTHTIPSDAVALEHLAIFCGFRDTQAFSKALLERLNAVHWIFASSFRSAQKLGDAGNLVFTGVSHDPETLETLRGMGYRNPERVSEMVMAWHHGAARATRTRRARELITEIMPDLLRQLASTANPDAAFLKFDEFLTQLPSGIQLFSLFTMNRSLLALIADIMGSAPMLAETLARHPELLDAVLTGDFYAPLPARDALQSQLATILAHARDFEDVMQMTRSFRNEKQFQGGIHLLRQSTGYDTVMHFLSDLADVLLGAVVDAVQQEFARSYGRVAQAHFAVIALGKLGSREMTFTSDIDLVFVYEVPADAGASDGAQSLSASQYFNRLGQRIIGALTALSRAGRLYEVDTRLRPSGQQGMLAVSLEAFDRYFSESAWTFEFMALTRARVVTGGAKLAEAVGGVIARHLAQKRDRVQIMRDADAMRLRIEAEHPAGDPWNLKYVRGGLMDLDFIAQSLVLISAGGIIPEAGATASTLFAAAEKQGLLAPQPSAELQVAYGLQMQLFALLRLCSGDGAVQEAPAGLRRLLASACGAEGFEVLEARLREVQQNVRAIYAALIAKPAQS